ncbi:MAG TPA: hypothetical protein VHZ97_17150 [Pseudonocardiaceae bacterium]|nr:hypothetical protein [Pseudonocardiaceae bacterium]
MNIQVRNERDDHESAGVTEAELRTLVARIGAPGDQFVVVERQPVEPEHFVQTWHENGKSYEVEFRDGGPERHYATGMARPDEVTDFFLAWINRAQDWRGPHDWQLIDASPTVQGPTFEDIPDIDVDTLDVPAEALAFARTLVHGGFRPLAQVVTDVVEHCDVEPITREQSAALVVNLWRERVAEQRTWPEITDPDRVTSAFDQLNAKGIVARQDFACCQNCGVQEIRAEVDYDPRGYTFFHGQDTDRAANGGGLWLTFGTFVDAPDTQETVGTEVVAALTEAGLSPTWNGDANRRITIHPLVWHKRLPTQ